jgi:phenylacetate-coenzyme A ligase PaaK-like adenylate-forming protein
MAVHKGWTMSLWEELHQILVGRITFPATNYLLHRKDILSRYRKLLLAEHYSKEAIRELQFQKLSAVLQHAYARSPFYRQRFMEIGLIPQDIKTMEDMRRIPPLTRRDLTERRLDLLDTRYRESALAADRAVKGRSSPVYIALTRRHGLIRRNTSGSTGIPTVFYEDGSTTALNWVHELRLKHWFGLRPGAKEARMSVIASQYKDNSKIPSLRQLLWNQMTLPGYFLSDREYELCVRKIRKFRPRILWGPTAALTGLARFVRRTNEDISQCLPDLLITRAAPLYAHEKDLLTEVFGCPVTNIYGTRELGHVAMNCPHGSAHVNQLNYLVEIESVDIKQGSAGPGNILVTPLFESPMPFLRYRVGDIAELGESDCPCGRPQMVIKKMMGRTGEVFKTQDGRLIEPGFWCIAFEGRRLSRDVERFQVVFRRQDCVRIRIVRRAGFSAETEADLRHYLDENFPSGIQFELEYVPEIKPQSSGKYLLIVNEIERHEEQTVGD